MKMVDGKTVYSTIKKSIKDSENNCEDLASQVNNADERIVKLRQEKDGTIMGLAKKYLPGLDADSVSNSLSEVRGKMEEILGEEQARRSELEGLISDARKERQKLENELDDITLKLDNKADARDSIVAQIKEVLNANERYKELAPQIEQLRERVGINEENLRKREEHNKPEVTKYNGERLFRYLIRIHYGTLEYKRRRVTRFFDGLIARYIDFKAREDNYDNLRSHPGLMRTLLEERRKKLDELVSEAKKIEDNAAQEYGLIEAEGELQKLMNRRREITSQMQELDAKCTEYQRERKELESSQDYFYDRALQVEIGYLASTSIRKLMEMADRTEGTEDNILVKRIAEIDKEMEVLEDGRAKLKGQRESVGDFLVALEWIKDKYDDNEYDAYNSRFNEGFDISQWINGLLKGDYTKKQVWKSIVKDHYFEKTEVYIPTTRRHEDSSYRHYSPPSISIPHIGSSGWSIGGHVGGGGWSIGGRA